MNLSIQVFLISNNYWLIINLSILAESSEGKELKRVLDKVEEMRKQRSHLIDTFSQELDMDDISKRALSERELNPKKLFEAEILKHNKNIQLIEQNCHAQGNILKVLTGANANFAEYRHQIIEGNERSDCVYAKNICLF